MSSSSQTVYPVLVNGYWCWNASATKAAGDGFNPNKTIPPQQTQQTVPEINIKTYDSAGITTETNNIKKVDIKI